MDRVLEPEVMDDAEQSRAYARADFASVNQGFVDRFRRLFPELVGGIAIDLGCGPADIPLRLGRALPALRCAAVDASLPMLAFARDDTASASARAAIWPVAARLPDLPFRRSFDAVISNSLLHHLPEAAPFWRAIAALARPGAAVLIMDLHRPDSAAQAAEIVAREAGGEPEILRHDFLASLRAAFRLDEVRAQIAAAGLPLTAELASDRHWVAFGRLAATEL